ncbi:MAG: putative bifunctional diguanylate cyclase/phosphodiesterase [Trueperaceae bacterium]
MEHNENSPAITNPSFRAFWKAYLNENDIISIQERALAFLQSGLIICDARSPERPIIFCNEAFTELTGYRSEEVLGRSCRLLQGPDTSPLTLQRLRQALNTGQSFTDTLKNYRKDGSSFWNELNITPIHDTRGDISHFVGIQHDVSAKVNSELALREANKKLESLVLELADINEALDKANAKLHHFSLHDSLTGIANRVLFDDHLHQAFERCKRHQDYRYAVLYIDLDGFKDVNDSYGHKTGDTLLARVADILKNCVRPLDTVARLAGDEFAVLLEDLHTTEEASVIAERILEALTQGCDIDGRTMRLSASIGIVTSDTNYTTSNELLHDADTAMYQAKALGKNQSLVFELSMRQQGSTLYNELREAIEGHKLEVYYQPIFTALESQLMGFEALVRWHHPKLGLIGPETFIPIAEQHGLIITLDRYVLSEACQQISAWQTRISRPLVLNVNFSGYQLFRSDLIPFIKRTLAEHKLKASQLRIELTETILMNPVSNVQRSLKDLDDLGIQLYIDDFGMGYSSLSSLQHLPSKALKIDRSFTQHVHLNPDQEEMVRTIVTMAHNLGMRVVAEGIETENQLTLIRALGCEYAQGYYFSPALPAHEVEKYLSSLAS